MNQSNTSKHRDHRDPLCFVGFVLWRQWQWPSMAVVGDAKCTTGHYTSHYKAVLTITERLANQKLGVTVSRRQWMVL